MKFLRDDKTGLHKKTELSICPILSKKYEYEEKFLELTEKDYKRFCSAGCSITCDAFYQEFLMKRYKKKLKREKLNKKGEQL